MLSVSILIRNRNEAESLKLLLSSLRQQHKQEFEIVVVDNESSDLSRQYIKEFNCRLVHLPAGQFTYGRATNLGAEHCSGDLIVMLSSHSLPVGRHFIEEVTAPFSDPRVAAVRIPMTSNTAELTKLPFTQPLDQTSTAEEVFRRGPVASGCVFRRSIWMKNRFNEDLVAAEDKEWALRVLRDSNYIIPIINAVYCYTRPFEPDSWTRKIIREETAGLVAAGLQPQASFKTLMLSMLAGQRDLLRKDLIEVKLYILRSRLNRRVPRKESV